MEPNMARKRHKPEEIIAKLRQVDVLTGQGRSISEAVKTIAVTETTYFRWRSEYGGMKTDQVKRLKALVGPMTRIPWPSSATSQQAMRAKRIKRLQLGVAELNRQ